MVIFHCYVSSPEGNVKHSPGLGSELGFSFAPLRALRFKRVLWLQIWIRMVRRCVFFHSLNFLVKIRRRSSHDNSQFPENEGIKLIQCSAKVRCGGFIPRISQKWRNGGTPKSSILWDFPWNKPSILGILHSNGGNGGLVAPRSLDSTPATRPRRARPPIARPIAEGGVPPRGYQRLPLK